MSFRSSLAAPSASSGQVGSSVLAYGGTGTMATGQVYNVASVSLPAGVYAINQCVRLDIAATTVVGSIFTYLAVTPLGGVQSVIGLSEDGSGFTAAAAVEFQTRVSTTIVLSTPSLVTVQVGANFSVAGMSYNNPIDTAYNIQAIKLA